MQHNVHIRVDDYGHRLQRCRLLLYMYCMCVYIVDISYRSVHACKEMYVVVYTSSKKLKHTIIVFPHLVMLTSTWLPLNTDNVCTLVLLLLLLHLVLLGQSWRVATTIEHLSPGHPWWSHAERLVTIGCHLVRPCWWRRLNKE